MGFIKPNNNSGGSGGGLTPQELSRLNNAYTHSKSEHAPITAEQNVQPDWNETDTTSDAYIKNKPDLSQIGGGGNIPSVTQIEPQESDMPKVFFYGNALPTNKDNVNLTMDYISNTDRFSSYIKLKCQGTSSMSYAKKNFTVNMYSDEARATKLKKDFKGWGAQSKFCLKANWVDTTHTRNISGARIGYDMVVSRPDSAFKQQLLTAPRYGLVDGFPIKLYFNGEFHGIYTWNIPKDAWQFNMDESNPNHCVLCAETNTDGNDRATSCNFRKLWSGSGEWSVEVGTATAKIKASFDRCINFVMTATDVDFKANIGQYFDLYSLLDYYCFSYFTCHLDGLAKNMLMATYDGVIWGASLYDMDSIYGVQWNGNSYVATNYQCPEQYLEQFSLLWKRIEECFGVELYARYLELRQGALSLSNIIKHVEEIYDVIPDRVFADEKAKWTNLPQVSANTMTRFRNYMRDRAVYVDAQMLEIGTKIPCTGITLSANNLSFTTTDTQTLTATVQPTNATDVVTWSVSPTGIVTIDNGVVTPVANGECTITATCGGQTATCTVNVALSTVACTSISLDKTELTLGIAESGGRPVTATNLLDGVNTSISGSLLVFDSMTLETGLYKITNINGGGFTWLGYTINGSRKEPNGNTTTDVIFQVTGSTDVIISGNPNGGTSDQLALYKLYTINPLEFTKAGDGYFDSLGNVVSSNRDVYSETFSLDSSKQYALMVKETVTVSASGSSVCALYDGTLSKGAGTITGNSLILIITNASTLAISANISTGLTLSDIVLYELADTQVNDNLMLSYQLNATVEPSNTTDAITWSSNAISIAIVDNGLVTANSNGSAVITATCGSQSATCNVTVSGMSESGGNTSSNLVFKIDSTSMNTTDNTLTDNIAGISATLTGNPTVSGNQIVFDVGDTFSFDISSLNLTNSNRTFRIKFTPTTLDTNIRNVIGIGSSARWSDMTTCYIKSDSMFIQHSNIDFNNNTVGSDKGTHSNNRLPINPVAGQEYELVISENIGGNVRWFVDGTLVQDGTTTLFDPLYLCNTEGINRFIGSYSLIEIYDGYCNDYTKFTNMVNSRNA